LTAKIGFFYLNLPKIIHRLTLIDLQGSIPTFVKITPGSVHDVNILDQIPIKAGAFYIMDMGYIDYLRLYRIQQAGGFFVIRTKENMAFNRVYSHASDNQLGIQVDQTIKFTNQQSQLKYPAHLRRIKFYDREKDKTFIFLANHFEIDAPRIAGL
jgi:transposase